MPGLPASSSNAPLPTIDEETDSNATCDLEDAAPEGTDDPQDAASNSICQVHK